MQQQREIWQVMVEGQIYEADFNTLVQWHAEGCFHPTDSVRKEGRNWIEAGKVPTLIRIFRGQTQMGQPQFPPPVAQQFVPSVVQQPSGTASFNPQATNPQPANTVSNVGNTDNPYHAGVNGNTYQTANYQAQSGNQHYQQQNPGWQIPPPPIVMSGCCMNHPQTIAKYICRMCSNLFCVACPKKMGVNVMICPACGDICKSYEQLKKKSELNNMKSQGFGLEDLGRALAYPFKFPAAFIGGALVYAIFLFGGLFGWIIANMILFGCVVVVIRQVAWGRMDRNFIANIGDNGIFEDLFKPGFLGFGATFISWGPFILAIVLLIWTVMDTGMKVAQQQTAEMQKQMQESEQSREFRDISDPSAQSEKGFEAPKSYGDDGFPNDKKQGAMPYYVREMVKRSVPIMILALVGFIWAIFYYPMALTVAGYTQDFLSTINPLVGIDTMKRMGLTYFKAFGMYIVIAIIAGAMNIIVAIVTMPFSTPPFGNIPKNLIESALTYYTYLVIACLLGLALFKSSDKLGIETD